MNTKHLFVACVARTRAEFTTHLTPWDGDQLRGLCGVRIAHSNQIARNGNPTCQECQRIDAEDAASLIALQRH